MEALSEYIEAELNNALGPTDHVVRRHLGICPECASLYLELLQLALDAEQGLRIPDLRPDPSLLDSQFTDGGD